MSNPIVAGVALREDDRAPIALAGALAGLTGAPLALVTSYPYGRSPLFVTPEAIAALREQAGRALASAAAEIGAHVEVSTHVRPEMSPALALRDVAIELHAAAIVVGSSHRGRVGRVLAGNVATACCTGRRARSQSRRATTKGAPTASAGSASASSTRWRAAERFPLRAASPAQAVGP